MTNFLLGNKYFFFAFVILSQVYVEFLDLYQKIISNLAFVYKMTDKYFMKVF